MSLVSISNHAMYNGAETFPLRGIGSVLFGQIKTKAYYFTILDLIIVWKSSDHGKILRNVII